MEQQTALRKNISLENIINNRQQLENIDYWRNLNPGSGITDFSLKKAIGNPDLKLKEIEDYKNNLAEEGYFQSVPLLPEAMTNEMYNIIERIRSAGLPPMFALVYDVFYSAFSYFDEILTHILGEDYKLVPNFWLYYINPADNGKGFEPHRDAEYFNTIGADGVPSVITMWITITEANPLNSCIYILPKNRDPEYLQAMNDLKTGAAKFALEDLRALPTKPGVLSCWDQYVFHWGSRSSKHAVIPRISYAFYCQRGDVPPVDSVIDLREGIDFSTRLALICRGLYRYSYLSVAEDAAPDPVREFLEHHKSRLMIN
jgi:hypothetical protein